MSENFLHFLWQHKLYKPGMFFTSNNKLMEVVDPGLLNSDAGPDFFNAKIKLDGILWAGNVEIHIKASDWKRHNHHTDRLYDNVILHVVFDDDERVYSTTGRLIPAWKMDVSQQIQQKYYSLSRHKGWIACEGQINRVPGFLIRNWIERMLVEKLERKVSSIETLLASYRNDWQEVFYIVLARNFGFGLNGEPFERLARQTPWKIVGRNATDAERLEALFLGQAGFLDGLIYDDDYMALLNREYVILKQKYSLEPLPVHLWKFLRLRPVNFPTVRLVQLAALIAKNNKLFDALLHCENLNRVRELLKIQPLPYWNTHYRPCVTGSGESKSKKLGKQAVDLIIINTVIPLIFAYGKLRGQPELQNKALEWLSGLPVEKNNIVSGWARPQINVNAVSAADSQGLVFLKRTYCDHRKCLSCHIGHRIVSHNFQE